MPAAITPVAAAGVLMSPVVPLVTVVTELQEAAAADDEERPGSPSDATAEPEAVGLARAMNLVQA